MSYRVERPILQPLGFQGEEYFLKIVFPVNELEEEDINDLHVPAIKRPAGKRGVILKFRTEDLPMYAVDGMLLHFDVGRAIREQFGVKESEWGDCKRCGSPIGFSGHCSDEACPYSTRQQSQEYVEG